MNKYKCIYVCVCACACACIACIACIVCIACVACVRVRMCVCTDMRACTYIYVNLTENLELRGQRKQKILENENDETSSVDVFVFEDATVNFSIT